MKGSASLVQQEFLRTLVNTGQQSENTDASVEEISG